MQALVIGFEISEGTSKKTGQPYSIGKLYSALPMSGAKGAKGMMGTEYQCEVSVLRKIEHLIPPFNAELEMQDVMRYGKREQQIVSVVPVGAVDAQQPPQKRAATA
jgi:hypothetical protein